MNAKKLYLSSTKTNKKEIFEEEKSMRVYFWHGLYSF